MLLSPNVTSLPVDGPIERLTALARTADGLGYPTIWIPDHLQQVEPGRSPDEPVLESSTALTWLAAHTSRIRLGAMVVAAPLRPPALTVKQVTDLHTLSGGRAWLGLGAGYPSAETAALGLPSPDTADRFAILEDTLALARRMWSGDGRPFTGARVHAASPSIRPLPVGKPPRVLVGGTGEKRTLRLVAEYADACNFFDIDDRDLLRYQLEVLDAHLRTVGRTRDDIHTTISTRWRGTDAATFVRRVHELQVLGFREAVVLREHPWTTEDLEQLAEASRMQ